MPRTSSRVWDAFSSLKLTIACLALLMVLVVGCTLAEARVGTFAAVDTTIRSLLIYWSVPGTGWSVPIFPGGALVGLVLSLNLVVAQVKRFEMSLRKLGLWIVHLGLILLFAGEFVTSLFQVETRLAIEEGQTVDFVESPREMELAVVDTTEADHDVYAIPQSFLVPGKFVEVPGTPFVIQVKGFSADRSALLIEPFAGPKSHGTWLVSKAAAAPQSFVHDHHTYALSLRNRREHLPFAVTLKKFRHDTYPGTDIPKNFSSLVHLSRPSTGEERDVLISMNQPFRYAGKAFYQQSFGKDDTLSILQVVQNPGWLLPYASCVLVAAGLLFHFALSLRRSLARRHAALEV
jgi:ResB-like family